MFGKLIEFLTGGPRVPVSRCEFVDMLGVQCSEKAKHSCAACGIKLCEIDAYVNPLASLVERRDNRYCLDCHLVQEEKLQQAVVTRLLKRRKS